MLGSSIRRSILIYAAVFMLSLAFALVTLASGALLRTARQAYLEGLEREVRTLAASGRISEIRAAIRMSGATDRIGIATATVSALDLTLDDARQALIDPVRPHAFTAAPLSGADPEVYVVGRLDPAQIFQGARSEIRRLIVLGLGSALALGALLAVMIGRLVLPPLSALRQIAGDSHLREADPSTPPPPNEVAEVAQAFRRTLRTLRAEREQIERQHQELARMQESLIRASKLASLGRLAAGIAHEIGNPLAAVIGYLALMRRGLDPVEIQTVLERSSVQLQRIHDTIRKLLTYARPDPDSGANQPLSTGEVVEDALQLLRGHPALRHVHIENLIETLEGPDASGRPGPLGQVLVNLVINAGQAMQDQTSARITIRRYSTPESVLIAVEDTGPGVGPDKLEQIFDPFYTTKPPGEGTGLGLAVSRALVESMHGELSVESPAGAGARFLIRLLPV